MSETGDQAPAKPARRRPRKKAQTPARAYGRSLSDFEPLKPAEQKLLEAAAMGKVAKISDKRPEEATEDNTVRAVFLRFLLLGGDERTAVHERGIQLYGAWVIGVLDLENSATVSALDCKSCTFKETLNLYRSNLHNGVFLQSSSVPGIAADGALINGDIFLSDGFTTKNEVRLLGAQISGDLVCSKAEFNEKTGDALSADRAIIRGGVFLSEGFKAVGTVRLPGTLISGNLDCSGSQFDGNGNDSLLADGAIIQGDAFLRDQFKAIGTVRLVGTQVGGNLECNNADFEGSGNLSIHAQSMQVAGGFIFRALLKPVSKFDLSAASVGVLVDDTRAWRSDLILDGFSYGSIGGGAPTNAVERLAWLDKQFSSMSGLSGSGEKFRPQPWKQLQKTLRDMGHNEEARQVAMAFEHRLRMTNLIGQSPDTLRNWPKWTNRPRRWIYRKVARGFHWCFWILTGYGYRPMRLMAWMLAVWLCSAAFYWSTALTQPYVFAPSNPLVFQHPHYQICAPETPESKAELAKPPEQQSVVGAGNWYLCEKLRGEYTGFSPLAYSLDVLLPLVDLQQQKDWGPIIPTPKSSWWQELFAPSWGHAARLVIWFQTLFGWVASLLLVAIVSGLTKRRED